jgi:hypothetical protein
MSESIKLDTQKPIRETEKSPKAYAFYNATKNVPTINPTETEDKKLNVYKWGADNLYPNYLATLYYNCAIHGGVIRQKVHYTVSGGLGYNGPQAGEFAIFFKNGNSDYNLDEVTELLSQDLEVYNGYAFTINFVKGRAFQIDHVPFEQLRKAYNDEEFDWYSSDDWSDRKESVRGYTEIDSSKLEGQQIVVYKEEPKQIKLGRKVTKGIYPAPPYSGGILAIETDIEINNYRRNEIYNNFSLGTIINFNNGQPTEDSDRDDIINDVAKAGQGSSNAGGIFATFNNGKDRETTVTNLTGNNLDQRYMALSKDNKENILLAHSVTNPLLFGIKTEGQLGGATELKVSYSLMKSGYFKYRQRAIITPLQYVWSSLLGKQGEIYFKEVSLDLPEEEKPTQNTFNFGSTDPVVDAFKTVGRKKSKRMRILHTEEANPKRLNEEGVLKKYKKFEAVTDMQVNVLAMLHEGNDFDTIRKAINVPASKLSQMIDNLKTEGHISGKKVTDAGIRLLAGHDKVTLSVVYSYEVRPELGQPDVIPTTRGFCRELIALNRVYTRGEIEQVSAIVDRDVWLYRGGWYHNPNTDKNTPFCRHYWQQNIILE